MADKKKPWTRPQLIVLGRGRPEESVLDKCRNFSPIGRGPNTPNCLAGGSSTRCKEIYDS